MDPEKFERQMETMLANQARHDDQIRGLIRVAELQQTNLERLEESHTRLETSVEELKAEVADSVRESREERKAAKERADRFDERVDRLVSAIGEWIRQSSARN